LIARHLESVIAERLGEEPVVLTGARTEHQNDEAEPSSGGVQAARPTVQYLPPEPGPREHALPLAHPLGLVLPMPVG
jgi:hypothetical protein